METLYTVAAFCSLLLFILSISKSKNSKANLFLALFVLAFGIQITTFTLSGKNEEYFGLLYLRTVIPFAYGPLLFLYVLHLCRYKSKITLKQLLHFIPALGVFIFEILYLYVLNDFNFAIEYLKKQLFYHILKYLVISSIAIYIIGTLVLLKKYQKKIYNRFSYTEKIDLKWLNVLIYSFLIIWFITWTTLTTNRLLDFVSLQNESNFLYPPLAIFVIFLAYFGLKQTNVFSKLNIKTKQEIPNPPPQKKENSASQFEIIFYKVEQLMNEKKLYLEPDLSIDKVSNIIKTNSNYVSKAINSIGKKSFFNYINNYRINEFKERIRKEKNKDFTIIAIAYDCGFNSKASFNRIFKNQTGVTPSQYRAKLSKTS